MLAGGQAGPRSSMSERSQNAGRNGRRSRPLSAQEKYQIWRQLLTGELTQRRAAEQWNVDPTTIMRIRRVGREGALAALAQSRPGRRDGNSAQDAELRAARAEIARLEETVKEQAIELVASVPDHWVGTSVKYNPSRLEAAPGLRVAIVPTQSGRSDAITHDQQKNLIICPVPHDAKFMQTFHEGWRIVQALCETDFENAEGRRPAAVPAPRSRPRVRRPTGLRYH
jgi:transposase-like protein